MTGEDEFVHYLEIMDRVRGVLANELDKIKFKGLGQVSSGNEVLYRNFVYAHMLSYKYGTAQALKILAEHGISWTQGEQFGSLRRHYGLDEHNRRLAFELKDRIENEK